MGRKDRVCPECGRTYTGVPALSRRDNLTEICPDCGVVEALEVAGVDRDSGTTASILGQIRGYREVAGRRGKTPRERTGEAAMATGNRWAMENFRAVHD